VEAKPGQPIQELSSGLLTPLMFAEREDDLESARLLIAAGADVNATGGDGKDALGLAIFNGSYDVASFLIDSHSKVNQPDAQRFTPLFWAVDRRNMETTGASDNVPCDTVGLNGISFIQDPLEYGTRTHHSNMDVYDRVQSGDMAQMAAIVASFVYHAANREEMLPRVPLPKPQPARPAE
jgi:hypothetical protein